jgi:hypothetical protein
VKKPLAASLPPLAIHKLVVAAEQLIYAILVTRRTREIMSKLFSYKRSTLLCWWLGLANAPIPSFYAAQIPQPEEKEEEPLSSSEEPEKAQQTLSVEERCVRLAAVDQGKLRWTEAWERWHDLLSLLGAVRPS